MGDKTQLDYMYRWEKERANDVWLTQPMGGGEVLTLTFAQAMDEVRRMAAHLKSLGFRPGTRIALFAKNNAWWMLSDLAIWMAGHVSVPLYPTLTADTIRQILDHSGSKLIFIGKLDGFKEMEPGIPDGLPRIVLPLAPKIDAPLWADIVKKVEPLAENVKRDPKDLATIIYTSGSTGVPKGVMHSFATMTAGGEGFASQVGMGANDRMLSYLPLAHALERALVETVTFVTGMAIWFAESLDTFVDDIKRAKPTIFVSVPRLWTRFQSGVFAKMPPGKLAFYLKIPILSGIVRKKVLTALGLEHVRFAGSGSAPIPAEVIGWYRSLGLELLEGYGMTENFSFSHTSRVGEVRPGYVGRPAEGCEQKLGEGNEILVKSPATMLGYYEAPELTAEMFTADGWLRTGDQGELDELGRLKITGRVKELFKTSKGKYVAPSPIENKLLLHQHIELACVAGASQPQPFALVGVSDVAKKMLKDEGQKAELEKSIAAHIETVNAALDPHEQLQIAVVVSDDWTIENGMLTPTMKLKRSAIEKRYNDKVDGWYKVKGLVTFA